MAFTMNIQAQLPAAVTRARHSASRRASAVVRAEGEASSPAAATVYFTNKAGQRVTATNEEYATAVAAGNVYKASSVTGIASPLQTQGVSLVDAMSFNGVPELINGRLAMIAIVAALAAELSSHETVLRQLADQPTGVVLVAVLIAAASLVPVVEGKADTKSPLGFLNASAEMVNSRAAMMGFVALLCTERLIGHSLL